MSSQARQLPVHFVVLLLCSEDY